MRKPSGLPMWLKNIQTGENVAVSTRVRLARNVKDFNFPLAASAADKEKIVARFEAWVAGQEKKAAMEMVRLHTEPFLTRGVLAERGLISMETSQEPDQIALAVAPDQSGSLLINEEDHLRIQVMQPGLNLETALKRARQLEQALNQTLPFANHADFGYLTACPTNVGTGLRASVMLHLPGLALGRGIAQVIQAVLHMGLAVRGLYGEGTELRSVYFQISNQVTMGRSEEEILNQLQGVVRQIIGRENEARQKLLKEERLVLEDKVHRASGILAQCRLLGFEEALDLLSTLRLGSETGVIPPISRQAFHELLLLIQPAHLQAAAKKELSATDQLKARARLVKKKMGL